MWCWRSWKVTVSKVREAEGKDKQERERASCMLGEGLSIQTVEWSWSSRELRHGNGDERN